MDNAVLDYYLRVLRPRFEVLAVATATKYQYRGRSWTSASYIDISQGDAYIQVSHSDVCIDFLEMPGVKRDGKVFVTGTRIYMPHVEAQKFAEVLAKTLERVHTQEDMEKYHSKEKRETKSD